MAKQNSAGRIFGGLPLEVLLFASHRPSDGVSPTAARRSWVLPTAFGPSSDNAGSAAIRASSWLGAAIGPAGLWTISGQFCAEHQVAPGSHPS
jgi:hypothetical protein